MTNKWPTVRLGEVLHKSVETIELRPDAEYRQITVKLWGKGVALRRVVTGAQIAASRQTAARREQFILSRIDARNGAFGIVPDELEGAVISNDFPVFNIDTDRLVPSYLGWLCQTHAFVEICRRASEGTTNRVRLQEEKFLAQETTLPPLAEQHRLVLRIEQLTHKITEARSLRERADQESGEIVSAVERKIWEGEALRTTATLEKVTTFLARGRQSEQGDSTHYLIKTKHVQQGEYIPTTLRLASHVAAKINPQSVAKDGDILIACSAAGCLGRVARYRNDGRTASTDTHVAIARPNPDLINPDYLYAYLRGVQGQHQLRSRERGDWTREKIGFRLTELNLNDLRKLPVPLPSPAEQRRVVSQLETFRTHVDALKRLQAETKAVIEALTSSVLDKAFRGEL